MGRDIRYQPAGVPPPGDPRRGAGEISGHHHPKAAIPARGTSVSRPCFVTDLRRIMMPAFGAYTGGLDVRDPAITRLFPRGGRVFLLGRSGCSAFRSGHCAATDLGCRLHGGPNPSAGNTIRVVGDVHGDAMLSPTPPPPIVSSCSSATSPSRPGQRRRAAHHVPPDPRRPRTVLAGQPRPEAGALPGRPAGARRGTLDATLAQLDAAAARARGDRGCRRARLVAPRRRGVRARWLPHRDAGATGTEHGLDRPHGALARALYRRTTGRMQPDGYPERSLRWVDRIPTGITVYCGHDRRSTDGRPYIRVAQLAAPPCSLTPAPARAATCRGSTCDRNW